MKCFPWYLLGIFFPGLGSDELERRTLGQSLVSTDKFIFVVKPFIEVGTKSLEYTASRARTGLTPNQ